MRRFWWLVGSAGIVLAASALTASQSNPPLPPPPLAPDQGAAPADDALQALSGEWRLGRTDGRPAAKRYTLTIWGSSFAAGHGCAIAQGYLRSLSGGRYRVEPHGPMPEACRQLSPPEPFDHAELHISGDRNGMAIRSRDGRNWLFAWSDPGRTKASDDFLRGDWLLADANGRPYRGAALTRVSFGERGYSVRAAGCTFETNGWTAERDWVVRPGGNQHVQTRDCRPGTRGDRLARMGSEARFVAEPVEGRLHVVIDGQAATLVPAARFPELSEGAKAYPVNVWAGQLAKVAARLPVEERTGFLMRVLGNADAMIGAGENALAIAFSGYSIAELDRLRLADLPVDGIGRKPAERSFEELLLGAPMVAVAELEAIEPADRGDGLALDYRYRVIESWRGGQRAGDLSIVRMPPLLDKSRSPLITPEPGARVLLLASRPGYLVAALRDGRPPSTDRRVIAMTLPLMRVTGGKLGEAVPGANVLGSARFAGMPVDEARTRARELDAKVTAAVAETRGRRRLRYFVTHVGSGPLPDPTRFWIDYDPDVRAQGKSALGAVTAWFDGCLTRIRNSGGHAPPLRACPSGEKQFEPAVRQAVAWIGAHGVPVTSGSNEVSEPFAALQASSTPPFTVREAIR